MEYEEDIASDAVPSYLSSSALGVQSLEEVLKTVQEVEVKILAVIAATTSGAAEQTVAPSTLAIPTLSLPAESAVPIPSPPPESAAPSLPAESLIVPPTPSLPAESAAPSLSAESFVVPTPSLNHGTASSGQDAPQEKGTKRKMSEGSALRSKRVKPNSDGMRRSGRTKMASKRALGMQM